MRTRMMTTVLTMIFGTILAAPTRADMPPPADYVENCTIPKQETAATECMECRAYYGEPDRCAVMLVNYCFTKVCKGWGASVWTEVLCRSRAVQAANVPLSVLTQLDHLSTDSPSLYAPDGGVRIPAQCTPSTDTSTSTPTDTSTSTVTTIPTHTSTTTDSSTPTGTFTTTYSSTASATDPAREWTKQDDGSACNVPAGRSALRAFGPLTMILAGIALVLLRRRSRRR
jgi:hypothetical protein